MKVILDSVSSWMFEKPDRRWRQSHELRNHYLLFWNYGKKRCFDKFIKIIMFFLAVRKDLKGNGSSSQILLSRPDSINSPEDFNINNIINFPMNFLNLLSNPSSGTSLPTQPSTSISPTPNSSHNPNSPTPSTPPPSARSPKTNPPPPPTSSSLPTVRPSIKSYPLPNPDGIKIKTDQSISSTQHPDAPERNPSARKTPWTCYRQRTRSDIEGRGRGKTRDRIKQKEDVKMP